MFVSNDQPQFETLTPGTHRMKVVGYEIKENGNVVLTFGLNGFKTNAFFKTPNLKEDGNAESWAKVVGANGGWTVSTKLWFEKVMGKEEVNRVLREASARISARLPTFEDQFKDLDTVKKAVKFLLDQLFQAATKHFKTVWFDVDLVEFVTVDAEGNEKTYLNVEKSTLDNNYKVPYRVSEDQSDPAEQVAWSAPANGNAVENSPVENNPDDDVPDWVNDRPARQEPTDQW